MTSTPPKLLRLIPMLMMMAVIFVLSHQTDDQLVLPKIPHVDKFGHFVLYGLLGLSVLFIPPRQTRHARAGTAVIAAVCVAVFYGITDEYHQSFIPGRQASIGDIVADGLGAAAFALFWYKNLLASRKRPESGRR